MTFNADDVAQIKKESNVDPEVQKIIDERVAEVKKEDNEAARKRAEEWSAERFNFALRILGFIQSTGVPKMLGIEGLPYAYVIGISNAVNSNSQIGSKFVDGAVELLKDATKSLISVSNSIKEVERKRAAESAKPKNAKSNS